MDSTMQDGELLVSDLLDHGARVHPEARVAHYQGVASSAQTYAELADRAARLAGALQCLGIGPDEVVATLCPNTPDHLAAYFAVPSMGAVLHTLNLRLSDEQLSYIINHAGDRVVLADANLTPQLARILPGCPTVTDVLVTAAPQADLGSVRVHELTALLELSPPVREWPRLPERSAAVLCYTTGTSGDPKGVAYSHRSIYLHTLTISTGSAFAFSDADRVLPIVPMFHANAWGWPYAAWIHGAELILPDRFLQPEHLSRMITTHRPTAAAAVPTVWSALDSYALQHECDFSSLRLAVSGGSPLPAALVENFAAHHGVHLAQGWGMTETSPLLTFSRPPAGSPERDEVAYRVQSGRLIPGVRARVMSETGRELPWDGASPGEIELRGPTITGTYLHADTQTVGEKFRDGWLRTGDLGTIHPSGWIELHDRLKDGIKSGGEWISSVQLENLLTSHPAVAEAAVIAVPDTRWQERPLACVRLHHGATAEVAELRDYLLGKVAKWWLPERWTLVDEIPKTSVGKLDKKTIRTHYHAERFTVHHIDTTSSSQ
jgi:fatty-acyl-CoA synthase